MRLPRRIGRPGRHAAELWMGSMLLRSAMELVLSDRPCPAHAPEDHRQAQQTPANGQSAAMIASKAGLPAPTCTAASSTRAAEPPRAGGGRHADQTSFACSNAASNVTFGASHAGRPHLHQQCALRCTRTSRLHCTWPECPSGFQPTDYDYSRGYSVRVCAHAIVSRCVWFCAWGCWCGGGPGG
jgi:hypothetical protein